jgi:hypothetical protein
MKCCNSIQSILEDIKEISSFYCELDITGEKLKHWVAHCVRLTIQNTDEKRETFIYTDCRIEYFKSIQMFSLIKTKIDNDGYATGTSYDIGINLNPYLLKFFGTDELPIINEMLRITDNDFKEISEELTEDILRWCLNVDSVFSQLSLSI